MNAAGRLWSCEGVVYDLDGTLVDTLGDLTSALSAALSDHGFRTTSPERVRESMHMGFGGSLDTALHGLSCDPAQRAVLASAYRRHYQQALKAGSRPFDGVQALLAAQQARGIRLAVCTNRDEDLADAVLVAAGLRPYIDAVVGWRPDRAPKPDPLPLHLALQHIGTEPQRAVLVGDSAVDLACAAAVGVPCLLFEQGYGGAPLVRSLPASERFASFASLLNEQPEMKDPR